MIKFRNKKSLADRVGEAIGRKSKKSAGVKPGLATAGGAVGLAVVSAVVSALRARRRGGSDAR